MKPERCEKRENGDPLAENIKKLLSVTEPDLSMPRTSKNRILDALGAHGPEPTSTLQRLFEKGETLMQQRNFRVGAVATVLSLILATGAVAVVLIQSDKGSAENPYRANVDAIAALQERIEGLEGRLSVTIGSLEEDIDRLTDTVSRLTPDESPSGVTTSVSAPDGENLADTIQSTTEPLQAKGHDDKLRSYITRVIKEERDARNAQRDEERRRHREELMALSQGPYGRHNFKVNQMAKILGLTKQQEEYYHANVVSYSDLIHECRNKEREDKENRQKYRDQRKELRKEFSTVFRQVLNVEQAETFDNLSEHEQRPDTSGAWSSYSYFTPDGGGALFRTSISSEAVSDTGATSRRVRIISPTPEIHVEGASGGMIKAKPPAPPATEKTEPNK